MRDPVNRGTVNRGFTVLTIVLQSLVSYFHKTLHVLLPEKDFSEPQDHQHRLQEEVKQIRRQYIYIVIEQASTIPHLRSQRHYVDVKGGTAMT